MGWKVGVKTSNACAWQNIDFPAKWCARSCRSAMHLTVCWSGIVGVHVAIKSNIGPIHKGANHVPKAVSDHDPLHDWVRDLNNVRSQALQPPCRSRTGSAHSEVILCSYCADWPMHGFSTRTNHVPKELCVHMSSESGFLRGSQSKTLLFSHFKRLIGNSFAFTKGKIRLSNQERVQITFRNGFRNVIRSFVNRPKIQYIAMTYKKHLQMLHFFSSI